MYTFIDIMNLVRMPDCFCRFHHSFPNGPKGSPTESAHVSEDGGRNPRKRKLHGSNFASLWYLVVKDSKGMPLRAICK